VSEALGKGAVKVVATHYFSVRGLFVAREVLGARYDVTYDGAAFELELPSPKNLNGPGDPPYWASDAFGPPSSSVVGDPHQLLSIRVVRVFSEVEFDAPADEDERLTRAWDVVRDAAEGPRAMVSELLRGFRATHRQTWLGLSNEAPRLLYGELRDPQLDEMIVNTGPDPTVLEMRPPERAITPADFAQAVAAITRGDMPPTAENLLSDAEYLAWNARPRDLTRAVLLAAVAAEVKVKTALRSKCAPQLLPLVDVVLDNPREVTLAAASLFDSAASAALGRSLRSDDRELYKRVVRLFEVRNRIAHYGEAPEPTEGADCIGAARGAFTWLDNLPSAT